jgi:hypothetical protein
MLFPSATQALVETTLASDDREKGERIPVDETLDRADPDQFDGLGRFHNRGEIFSSTS